MTVLGIFSGKVCQQFEMNTAIDKQIIMADVYLGFDGLDTDECADDKHHGGPERAIHQYPSEHYAFWQQHYQAQGIERDWRISSMGENISTIGFDENNVCIGDQFAWGEAIIEVSQPRSPCFKLNKRWLVDDCSIIMQQTTRCGWLYRVVKPGLVSKNATFKHINRVDNAMTIKQICDIYFGQPLDRVALMLLLKQPLSRGWVNTIESRLANNAVENWNFRLFGRATR